VAALRERIEQRWDQLSRTERTVARLLANTAPERLLYLSAQELGKQAGTSGATVVRAVQSLGYRGLPDLKRGLAISFSNEVPPETRALRRLESVGENVEGIWARVREEAAERLELAGESIDANVIGTAAATLLAASTVFSYGVGSSSIAAQHLATRLGRIGRSSRHLDDSGFRLADELLALSRRDAVVLFAPGRTVPDLHAIAERAAILECPIVVVGEEIPEALSGRAEVVIEAPHTPTGLTSEALTGILVGDALVHTMASADPETAVATNHELTRIRTSLGYSPAAGGFPTP
jgi:DNA-binding MurR/RpiR family transcriptional regulator